LAVLTICGCSPPKKPRGAGFDEHDTEGIVFEYEVQE
jgi:hypothetical protein